MIKDIRELNFPSYATLESATVALADMGEKTITAQIKIDGSITPDFSFDWEIEHKGEKYIMPLREPQASVENTSLDSTIDLTFQHWAQYQLKRWYFFTVQPVESGTAVPDKYIASVSLTLPNFIILFGQVLSYYYGDKIKIQLNPAWVSKDEPSTVEISHSYIWDVLLKLYELYAVRWTIEADADNDGCYIIKVGYGAEEITHVFEYGFEGGLLKVERQVQNENIRNMLIGRGGGKNLPYRYYKDVDKNNDSFPADPDWIPELANIHFDVLRGATFRSYIQGWKAKHYGGKTTKSSAYAPWAWEKGYTDEKFNPIEYVKDDESIAKYGPLEGGFDNNEEFHPTIQSVNSADHLNFFGIDFGRVDQTVAVTQINKDESEIVMPNDSTTTTLDKLSQSVTLAANERKTITIQGTSFTVPTGKNGDLIVSIKAFTSTDKVIPESITIEVYKSGGSSTISASGIPEGTYTYKVKVELHNTSESSVTASIGDHSPKLITATPDEELNGTFDIWIKNIWGTAKKSGETDKEYAERVWLPILGDAEGNEAKIVFSSGWLSTSEDYEFMIVKGGINYDTSKILDGAQSHWRLTLARCDAEYEATGKYIPNKELNANDGDYFFFTGIDMPYAYTVWAEERLDNWKKDQLLKVANIQPTRVVQTDRVRMNNYGNPGALIDQIKPGCSVILRDEKFIPGSHEDTLYIQSVTITYRKPSSTDNALNPDVEMTLGKEYVVSGNIVEQLQGEVSALQKQIGSLSNVAEIVEAIGGRKFIRKDRKDRTAYTIASNTGFEVGSYEAGASGGFLGMDADGDSFAEVARLYVRVKAFFEELTTIKAGVLAGRQYITPGGGVKCLRVEETATAYRCYFLSEQDGEKTETKIIAGDMAIAELFNAKTGTANKVSNHRYWRAVTAVSNGAYTEGGNRYGYIELSKTDCESGSDVPQVGDEICQLGNKTDKDRQTAMIFSTVGADAPSIKMYSGIDTYSLADKSYITFATDANTGEVYCRLGSSSASHYLQYSQSGGLEVAGRISTKSTVDGTPIGEYVKSQVGEVNTPMVEYSTTGAEGAWHPTFADGDLYIRFSTDGGKTWGAAMRFIGQDGTNGENGKDGVNGENGKDGINGINGINGENGKDGQNGSDGSYPRFQWAKNTSTTVAPTSGWQDTPLTASAGEYVWLRQGMVVPPATAPSSWEAAVRLTGDRGSDGTSPYTLDLDNEVVAMACDADGKVLGSYPTPKATVYSGSFALSSGVSFSIAEAVGVTASINAQGKVTLSALTAQSAYATVQAKCGSVTLQSRISLYKVIPGADGTSVGIDTSRSSTTYQASASATQIPTGTWLASIPAVADGEYLWTRVITHYTDGNETTAYSVSRQGSDGSSVGIASTEARYVWGNYPSQPSDSLFTHTSIGALAKGDWLWTRTKVTYTDGASTKSYAASYIGSDGGDGQPGTPGVDGKTSYTHFAYAAMITATTISGFSVTPFAGARYIGICTNYEVADPDASRWKEYTWSEYKGDDAVVYEIVPSVDSVTRRGDGTLSEQSLTCTVYKITGSTRTLSNEYTLNYQRIPDGASGALTRKAGVSSSVAVLPDTEAVIFELVNGSTVFDRERVPVLTDASGMEIGGENLLRNTDYIDGTRHWQWNGTGNALSVSNQNKYNARQSLCVYHKNTTETWRSVSQTVLQPSSLTTYTLSGYVKVENGSLSGITNRILVNTSKGETFELALLGDMIGKWTYFEKSFTLGAGYVGTDIMDVVFSLQGEGIFYINSIKLEKGNVATAWSASSQDVSYLRDALRESTASMEGGLICGTTVMLGTANADETLNVQAGMNGAVRNATDIAYWSGGKTVDADAEPDNSDAATFAIRHDGTAYAAKNRIRFRKDRLEIGKDGASTTIALLPEAKAMRIYDDDGAVAQQLSGIRHDNPINAFYGGSLSGGITLTKANGSSIYQGIEDRFTSYDWQSVAISNVIDSQQVLRVLFTDGTISVTASTQSDEVNYFAYGQIQLVLEQLDDSGEVVNEIAIADATASANYASVQNTTTTQLAGKIGVGVSAGRYRLAVQYAANMIKGSVTVRWMGLKVEHAENVYSSNFFANGYLLGAAKDNYVAAYNSATEGMVYESRMGEYGVRMTKAGVRLLQPDGSWSLTPMLLYKGVFSAAADVQELSSDGYYVINPAVSVSGSRLYIYFPEEWKTLRGGAGKFFTYLTVRAYTYNISSLATCEWMDNTRACVNFTNGIVPTDIEIYIR